MKRPIALLLALCLTAALVGCGEAAAPTATAVPSAVKDGYRVLVTDEYGAPVAGVTVQFCSDSECMLGETDDSGVAAFEQAGGSYTVHLLRVPERYAPDDTEYPAPAEPGLVTIVLHPAEAAADSENVIDAPQLGFRFVPPDTYESARGTLNWSVRYLSAGVQEIALDYYAVSSEQLRAYVDFMTAYSAALRSGAELPVPADPAWLSGQVYGSLFVLYAINGKRGEAELLNALWNSEFVSAEDFAALEEIGADGDSRFFLGQYAQPAEEAGARREAMGNFYAEYEALRADKASFLSALTLYEPAWPHMLAPGETIEYEAADLDGTLRQSADLFAGAKVTMINLWATWCPPCKAELPALGAMAKEFEEQGCQIIGVCIDAADDATATNGAALLKDAGADYLNLRAAENVGEVFPTEVVPVTLFVDSSGRILTEPIKGAHPEAYRQALADALALVG